MSSAPATTPSTPAADPASLKLVAIAPDPDVVLDAAADALPDTLVTCATWIPNPVLVTTLVVPPVVTVEVTTLVAVVLAVHPAQLVHGALLADVQPLHVLAGHPEVPHQLVQGPAVQDPVLCDAQGPQPLLPSWPPKGPTPPAPSCQPMPPWGPPGPMSPPLWLPWGPQPGGREGAPVVMVCQLLATLLRAEGRGCADVRDCHWEVAVGQAEREAAEVQELYSLPRLLQAEVSVGQPAAEAYEAHCEVMEAGGPCGP